MRKIKKFEPLSVMRIAAICYAAIGLLEGAMFSLIFSIIPLAAAQNGQNLPRFFGFFFGAFSIIVLPIFFAVIGAIGGGLGAVIYNVSARYVGGIEVEVE
jgi:hypothetical protein